MYTRFSGAFLLAFSSLAIACSSSSSSTTSTDDASPDTTSTSDGAVTDTGSPGEAGAGATSLSGTLGDLGAVQPIVASLWIQNSGETLVYMSSSPITCEQLKTSRWLGSTTKGSQVVEIVIKGAPKVADYPVPPGEVNYAAGGKSSSYEVNADSGKISFTKVDTMVVEGTVNATYASGSVSGTFHATFCDGGQGY